MQELKGTSNYDKKQLERKELTKLMPMGTSSLQNVAEHNFMITNKPPKQKKKRCKAQQHPRWKHWHLGTRLARYSRKRIAVPNCLSCGLQISLPLLVSEAFEYLVILIEPVLMFLVFEANDLIGCGNGIFQGGWSMLQLLLQEVLEPVTTSWVLKCFGVEFLDAGLILMFHRANIQAENLTIHLQSTSAEQL